jgi:YVTN family beta-propeller protein
MKPQPFATFGRSVCVLILFSAIFALPTLAAPTPPPDCSTTPLPASDPTAFVANPSANLVSVLDVATQTVVCTIPVGQQPTNLAVSPDGKTLFVETDNDASVSVIDLSSTSGMVTSSNITALHLTDASGNNVTVAITANLAVSPDGTFVYVVSLPQNITGTTEASLNVITLGASPTVANAISLNPGSLVPVNGPGLGIAFRPSLSGAASTAYIATESLTYIVTGGTSPTVSNSVDVSGGTIAIAPNGTFAIVVDDSANANTVSEITVPGNMIVTLNPSNASPSQICSQAGSVAITPDSSTAYYTCPGGNFVQAISTGASPTVIASPSVNSPQGIAIASDGSLVFATTSTGSVTAITTSNNQVSPSSSISGVASAPLAGIAFRPVQLAITPNPQTVATGATSQFTSTLQYAFGTTLTWAVNGTHLGTASTGTITDTGLFTAPSTLPAPPSTVTVSAASTEIPVVSLLYPSQSATDTVTITPSQLVITTQPTNGKINIPLAEVDVTLEDANGNPAGSDNSSSISIAISAPGTFSSGSTNPVTVTAGVAHFTNLVPTTPGLSFTLTATDAALSLTSQASTAFAIASGNPTMLVFTSGPVAIAARSCSSAITVQTQDQNGVPSNPPSAVNVTLASSSSKGTFYLDAACMTASITMVNIPTTANSATFYYSDKRGHNPPATPTITAADMAGVLTSAMQTESVRPGDVASVNVETAADGTGTVVPAQNVTAGSTVSGSVTGYSITRDIDGNFVANQTGTWSLANVTGGVLSATDLVVNGGGTSATFTAHKVGSATLHVSVTVSSTTFMNDSGTLTAKSGPAATLTITGSGVQTAGTSQQLTITAKDVDGNTATSYNGDEVLTFSGANPSANPVTAPTVTDKTGTARSFGTATTVTFASGVSSVGASMTLFKAETATIAVNDAVTNISSSGSNDLTVVVSPAPASKLVITGSGTQTAGTTQPLTITAEDPWGNVATNYAGSKNLTFSGAHPSPASPGPVTSPTVTNSGGTVVAFGSITATTFTGGVATVSGNSNGVMALYDAETASVSVTDGSLSSSGTGNLADQVGPAQATKQLFTTQPPASPSIQLGGNGSSGPTYVVTLYDPFGNVATTSPDVVTLQSTYSSTPANPAAVVSGTVAVTAASGVATFSSLHFTIAGTYALTATSPGVTSATSGNVTFITNITVSAPVTTTTFPITIRVGSAQFTTTVTGDPDTPGNGVTWSVSCAGGVPANCGTINASGLYTAPATAPSPATVTITAQSVTDPTKSNAFTTLTLVGDSALVTSSTGVSAAAPVAIVRTVSPTGTATVSLLGPAPSDVVTFAITCGNITLANVGCSVSSASTTGTATGATPVTVTFTAITSSTAVPVQPNIPSSVALRTVFTAWRVLSLLVAMVFFGLWYVGWLPTLNPRARRGFAFVFLLCLSVGWMSACTQFSQPNPPSTPTNPTQPGSGSVIVTFTPSGVGPGGDNFTARTVQVFFTVQ